MKLIQAIYIYFQGRLLWALGRSRTPHRQNQTRNLIITIFISPLNIPSLTRPVLLRVHDYQNNAAHISIILIIAITDNFAIFFSENAQYALARLVDRMLQRKRLTYHTLTYNSFISLADLEIWSHSVITYALVVCSQPRLFLE